MKPLQKLILAAIGFLLIASIIYFANYSWSSSKRLINSAIENVDETNREISTSYLTDIANQKFVGVEVVNLIKKYGKSYLIEINSELKEDKQSAVGAINTSALYLCQLKRFGSDGSLVVAEDVSTAGILSFLKIGEETVETDNLLDLSGLSEIVGGSGSSQDIIDAAYAYIVALREQNVTLSQNIAYEVDSGSILSSSEVELSFIPTDLIIYQNTGNAFYADLNGSILTANDSIVTTFSGVTIALQTDDNGIIKRCVIKNDSQASFQYRAIRAVNSTN